MPFLNQFAPGSHQAGDSLITGRNQFTVVTEGVVPGRVAGASVTGAQLHDNQRKRGDGRWFYRTEFTIVKEG